MNNVMNTIEKNILISIRKSLEKARELGEIDFDQIPDFILEVPREKDHGDFATNIAMQLTKQARKNPRLIAQTIVDHLDTQKTFIEKVEIAGPGFINFRLNNSWLYDVLKDINLKKESYGSVDLGQGKRINLEFVSANPTGPMHMGNGRGGALGDSLASILQMAGYQVTKEFYINDAGNQIDKFGQSLEARYLQLHGKDGNIPEGGYEGEDISQHARDFIEIHGDSYLNVDADTRRKVLIDYALEKNINQLKMDLGDYGINFDVWFPEHQLHGPILDQTIKLLKEKGNTYEKDGALWFRASKFGAEKDEVLIRNNGFPTYFAVDIAYHINKLKTRNFDVAINIWGADHHGHVARLKGAMDAVGIDSSRLEVIIMQLVRLFRNGEIARMSKRKGKAITLSDLVEEVGKDAARFFFNIRSSDSHLDFDLDLALKQSNENPVFYVQYAHARICSIIRQMEEEGISAEDINQADPTLLKEDQELDLMHKLAELPGEIEIAARNLEPSRITRYVLELASLLHSFYNACRVKVDDRELMKARLLLISSTRQVIYNVLKILGISAPEKM